MPTFLGRISETGLAIAICDARQRILNQLTSRRVCNSAPVEGWASSERNKRDAVATRTRVNRALCDVVSTPAHPLVTEVPLLRIVSVTAQVVVQATFRKIDAFLPGTGKKLGRRMSRTPTDDCDR